MESGDCAVEQPPEQTPEIPAGVSEVAENTTDGAAPQESSNGSEAAADGKNGATGAAKAPANTAKKGTYYCDVCDESVPESAENHKRKRKHTRLLERLEKYGSLEAIAATFKMVRCNICGTQSNTKEQMQFHLDGQKHRTRCLNLRINPKLTDFPPGMKQRRPMPQGMGPRAPLLPMLPPHMGPHPGPFMQPRMGPRMRGGPPMGGPMGMKRPYPMDAGPFYMDSWSYPPDRRSYAVDPVPPRAAKKPRQASNTAASAAAAPKPSFFCTTCNLVLNSIYQRDEHIKGSKHKDRASHAGISLEEAMPTAVPGPAPQMKQNGGAAGKQPGAKAAAKKKQDPMETCAPIRKAQLSMSYFHKPGGRPLLCCTTGDVVDKTAEARGDRIAIVSCHQGVSKTYTEYKKDIDQLTAGLVSLKLSVGSKIGIVVPNMYEWAVVLFAAAKAGLVLVNITTDCSAPELEYYLKHVDCEAVILSEKFASQDHYAMLLEIAPGLGSSKPGELKSARLPRLKHVILIADSAKPGTVTYNELVQSVQKQEAEGEDAAVTEAAVTEAAGTEAAVTEPAVTEPAVTEAAVPEAALPKVHFDDPASIQFTSGTTGKPKSVLLSHFNIVNNAETAGYVLGFQSHDDTVCLTLPMAHPLGNIIGLLASVTFGCTIVIPAASFDPTTTSEAIKEQKCTAVHATPAALALLPQVEADQSKTSTLRKAIVAGSSCSSEFIKSIRKKLNIGKVHVVYGSAECSPVVAASKPGWTCDDWMRTVGMPVDHVEV
ncbi:unnamed protein product, partial [Ixodes hexagonus]